MVTNLVDKMTVVAAADIYDYTGSRLLIAKHAPIRHAQLDVMRCHGLCGKIDEHLLARDGVTAESIAREARRVAEENPILHHLLSGLDDPPATFRRLANLPLPVQMAFKLTIAREQRPRLYNHLLFVILIAQYLALRIKLPGNDMVWLLLAALFHDFGELYIAPELLNPHHTLDNEDWPKIYAHPIAGFLIAHAGRGVDPVVQQTILQHQERLDGSGYPFGLRAREIGNLARILGVADVCASILTRFADHERLSALMRLNQQKYPPRLLTLLHEGFARAPAGRAARAPGPLLPRLKAVANLLDDWGVFRAGLSGAEGAGPPAELAFLFERIVTLRSMILQFGFDPDSLSLMDKLARDDPRIAAEVLAALGELRWQFADLYRETLRRRERFRLTLSDRQNRSLNDWIEDLRGYLALA